jgi:hypothetical protein
MRFRVVLRSRPTRLLSVLAVYCTPLVFAQTPLGRGVDGLVRLQNTDLAVFEAGDARKDLPCAVTPVKPVLGFDLRFHSGYDVSIPLRELAGGENVLTVLFRVAPANRPEEYVYFNQKFRVPVIEEDARGDALLQGYFDVGEGPYKISWLMRDRTERVCSSSWDTEAVLPVKDKQLALAINPGEIQRMDGEQFKEEPPIERIQTDSPLNVKVLVNFAPQKADSAALQPADTSALVSILRQISREPHIGRFSIVAFNMQEQRVLYRQDSANRIDFPALGEAVNTLNLGTIDLKRLGQKHGDTEFLTDLIKQEISGEDAPDALVFAGPKVLLDANVPQGELRDVGDVSYPVFYMNYNLFPQAVPWKDSISRAVKFFRGTEYTISRPRDLWFAVNDLVGKVVKAKGGRTIAAAAGK